MMKKFSLILMSLFIGHVIGYAQKDGTPEVKNIGVNGVEFRMITVESGTYKTGKKKKLCSMAGAECLLFPCGTTKKR